MGAALRLPETAQKTTISDYFVLDSTNLQRYEFYDGEIRAMSGGTAAHNIISGNIYRHIYPLAAKQKSRAFMADMRFQAASIGFFYPDVLVTCEPIQNDTHTVVQACMVAEILSGSTERYDLRHQTFGLYSQPLCLVLRKVLGSFNAELEEIKELGTEFIAS